MIRSNIKSRYRDKAVFATKYRASSLGVVFAVFVISYIPGGYESPHQYEERQIDPSIFVSSELWIVFFGKNYCFILTGEHEATMSDINKIILLVGLALIAYTTYAFFYDGGSFFDILIISAAMLFFYWKSQEPEDKD